MKALESTQAMFAEPDEKRLASRIRALTYEDLSKRESDRLAGGDLSLMPQLKPTSQQGVAALVRRDELPKDARDELEKIIGTLDYVAIGFLELAVLASHSVARVVDLDRHPIGTGVMVSPGLFLTNNHVTPSAAAANEQIIQFDYELGIDGAPRKISEFRLDADTMFLTSEERVGDFTLIAVGLQVAGPKDLAAFGYAPMRSGDDRHALGDFVTVIEHPDGRYKQIALRENRVLGRGKKGVTLYYGADTLPGASGSPVFNDTFELVALHHAGGPMNDSKLDEGGDAPDESNEGIRLSWIVSDLKRRAGSLGGNKRQLVLEAIDSPIHGPSLAGRNERLTSAASRAPRLPAVRPADGDRAADLDGWTRVILPVEIALRVGSGGVLSADVGVDGSAMSGPAAGGLERNDPPDPNYDDRRGYDPQFLTIRTALPALPAAAVDDVARPDPDPDGDGVIPYLHFSVVQNGPRKHPFFTAVNIDGKLARDINRKTGQVEAAEKWYRDPRLGAGDQLSDASFAHEGDRVFDRGHLVRRIDPAWGSDAVAKKASDDTFHFTNCSLQVWKFNEFKSMWQGIENYVLDNAKATDERISVFSGPVFRSDDRRYNKVQVPEEFWKIVVRVADGKRRATGFLASQADLLDELLAEAVVDWDELGNIKVYQRRIESIEAATGLDFGTLRKDDTAPKTESVRELRSLAEARF